jgi:antitoxin (DNA-binding transcriptional repressor) of toxin-antitoxin stability system
VKIATLHDLQTRLHAVLAWVKGGEDVMVKGEPLARPDASEQKVDWSHSAAFRDRTGEPVLTQGDLDELLEEMRGPY